MRLGRRHHAPEGAGGAARRRAEAVRESETLFHTVADTAPVMIWMSDTQKRGVFFNKGWLDFTGRRQEAELGEGWTQSIHPEDLDRCLDVCGGAFRARRPFSIDYRMRRRDGRYRWVLDNGVPRHAADGTFLGYIGSCIDITERREAELESARQRSELARLSRVAMLGELSGALAHELNQPLAAILSNAQAAQRILARSPADLEEVRSILADVVEEDLRAREVIQRLRLLMEKGEVRHQAVDLNEVVLDVLRLVGNDLQIQGVTAHTDLAPGLPSVNADRVQVQQVLLNLILNGCHAMSNGHAGDRRLVLRTEASDGDGVLVTVSDHGVGIPPEDLERIFDPFYTTRNGGVGLGLALCRSIIAAHGGRLWAINSGDRGASLQFALPGRPSAHA
jgi:PAS domain S-box-containing protein